MLPSEAAYWQNAVAWGHHAKMLYSGQDNMPVALICVGELVVWSVEPENVDNVDNQLELIVP